VTQVITNNLKRSGLFAPIDQAAYIERINNIDVAPQFQNWKTISAQALVTGRMTRQGDGRLKAEFRLWTSTPRNNSPASNISLRPNTGAASPTSSRTRSTNASPAKKVISTAAWCSSTRPAPRSAGSSGSR